MHCTPKMVTETKVEPLDFRSVAPLTKPAPAIAFGDYQTFTLENGIEECSEFSKTTLLNWESDCF